MESLSSSSKIPPLFNSQPAGAAAQSAAALSSDFETFLKMLTVQMENQDPLNPVDSADYAVQLATFSSVEQQVLTNDLLTSLSASMSGGGIGTLGQWVGMEVRAGNTAHFAGDEIELVAPETANADQRIMVVRDEFGGLATRINVPVSGSELSWVGALADGTVAKHGNYKFSVETYENGVLLETQDVKSYGRVREAIIANGETSLVLEGDIVVKPSEVSALRSPD